jgi:hypothetical protein
LKQYRELLKQNCWFISSDNLKKKTNKLKYPLGILILTDLHLPAHRLQHFKLVFVLVYFFLFEFNKFKKENAVKIMKNTMIWLKNMKKKLRR